MLLNNSQKFSLAMVVLPLPWAHLQQFWIFLYMYACVCVRESECLWTSAKIWAGIRKLAEIVTRKGYLVTILRRIKSKNSFFLSWVAKTQQITGLKRVVSTRLTTLDPWNCPVTRADTVLRPTLLVDKQFTMLVGWQREIMLFIGKPMGRSIMISRWAGMYPRANQFPQSKLLRDCFTYKQKDCGPTKQFSGLKSKRNVVSGAKGDTPEVISWHQ